MTKKAAAQTGGAATGAERRVSRRRPILETFSLSIVVPKKGVHRLQVHDASEQGLRFDLDTEGETQADYPLRLGDRLDLRLYLNQSLFIPLSVEVMRIEIINEVRQIGTQFHDQKSKNYRAFQQFLETLDAITEVAQTDKPQ